MPAYPPIVLEYIQGYHTLARGRQLSNSNDEQLASRLELLLAPAHVHEETPAATVWTVNHGLGSEHIIWVVLDTAGKKMEADIEQVVDDNTLELTFNSAKAGKVIIFLGRAAFLLPADSLVGAPTDGVWGDPYGANPAGIVDTDPIKDALDKLNEVIARVAPPPGVLSGDIDIYFPTSGQLYTARISSGTGQNLVTLNPGDSSDFVVTTDIIELRTPTSPANQFGIADSGVLAFKNAGTTEDSIDLGAEWDELERDDTGGQTWPGSYSFTLLQVLSVGKYLNIPAYQKGTFTVYLQSWLTSGEVGPLTLEHTVTPTTYSTNAVTLFFDDNTSLPNAPTVKLLEHTPGTPKYLDGIRYYNIGAIFSVVAHITDLANRTYLANPIQLDMPGATSKVLAWNASSMAITKDSSILDDSFTGGTIDTTKWTASGGVSQSGSLTIENLTPTASVNNTLTSNTILVKNSSFTVEALFNVVSNSAGGVQWGLKLAGPTGGSIELVYHIADDDTTKTIEAHYTPYLGVRTLHATFTQALTPSDDLLLHIDNTADNEYTFKYNLNGGGLTTLGTALSFDTWGTINNHRLIPSLFGANSYDTNLPAFEGTFDDFATVGGRAESFDTYPDIADSFDILAESYTLNNAGDDSLDAKVLVTPLSVRGLSAGFQSASQNMLVSTSVSTSTGTEEFFNDNTYRLPVAAYATSPVSATGNWTDTSVLTNGNAHVFAGQLQYPSIDFTTGYLPAQQALTDYSGFTGDQLYLRAWVSNGPKGSGTLQLEGVTAAQILASAIEVELKLPTRTGWLSLNLPFDSYTFTGIDGDGAYLSVADVGSYCEIAFTFGGFSTEIPGSGPEGMAIMRLTFPDGTVTLTYAGVMGWA